MGKVTPDPICIKKNCFGNMDGRCRVLNDNDFKGRPCPFFKTHAQIKSENKEIQKRLSDMNLSEAPDTHEQNNSDS